MISILVFGFFIVILSAIRWKQKLKGLRISLILLTFFLAIRYNFGNDYDNYFNLFNEVVDKFQFSIHYYNKRPTEIGWCLLCFIFKPLGFYGFIFVLTSLEGYLLYLVIKRYVQPNYYWLALFIYFFNPNLMLTGVSAMRQWLAICIVLFSIKYIIDRDFIKYSLMILVAYLVHTSAIICLPLFTISLFGKMKNSKVTLLFIVLFVFLYFIISNFEISQVADMMDESELSTYTRYLSREHESTMSISLIGIVTLWTLPIVAILRMSNYDRDMRLIVILYMFSLIVTALTNIIMMAVRINFYFWAIGIVAIPYVVEESKNYVYGKGLRILLIAITALPLLRSFYGFFNDPTFMDHYHYTTIFQVLFN